MAIVTLTTDLGLKDYYVAVLKGKILTAAPSANLVDISHEIQPFNIQEAAFILKNSYTYFPPKTIHLLSVYAENKSSFKCIALEYKKQFFVGVDNGLFSLLFEDHPEKIIELSRNGHPSSVFVARDILSDAASRLANQQSIDSIGKQLSDIERKTYLRPPDNAFVLKGNIVYVDRFGNVIVNISKERFENIRLGRNFVINYRRNEEFHEFKETYSDVPEGERLCLFNSAGYLEIAINHGNASQLLGLHVDDVIQIEFE